MDAIIHREIDFIHPFLSFQSEEILARRLAEELSDLFSIPEIGRASCRERVF